MIKKKLYIGMLLVALLVIIEPFLLLQNNAVYAAEARDGDRVELEHVHGGSNTDCYETYISGYNRVEDGVCTSTNTVLSGGQCTYPGHAHGTGSGSYYSTCQECGSTNCGGAGRVCGATKYKNIPIYARRFNCSCTDCGTAYITCDDVTLGLESTTLTCNIESTEAGATPISYTWSTGETVQTITVDQNGEYTCDLVYKDTKSGTTGSVTLSYLVDSLDIIPPDVVILSDPEQPTNGNVMLIITATDNVAVAGYSTNGIDFSDSDKKIIVTENGVYTGYAIDTSGNIGSAEFRVSNIDRISPILFGLDASTTLPTNRPVSLIAHAEDEQTVGYMHSTELQYIYNDIITNENPYQTSENGHYTLIVKDAAGNESNAMSIDIGNIDMVPPIISSLSLSDKPTNQNVIIEVAAEDRQSEGYSSQVNIKYSLDPSGADLTECVSISENGDYTIYAVDAAGNVSEGVSITVNSIDRVPPSILEWTIEPGEITRESISIHISAVDNESGLATEAYSLDGEHWQKSNIFRVDRNGTYDVWVRDKAGNIASTSTTDKHIFVGNIDTIGPVIEGAIEPQEWTRGEVCLSATAIDNPAGLPENAYSWYDGKWVSAAKRYVSENGEYIIKARDTLGNISSYIFKVSNIDRISPRIIECFADPEELTKGIVSIHISAADNESGLATEAYSLDGEHWQKSNIFWVDRNGTYDVWVRDKVGNTSSVELLVNNIDVSAPMILSSAVNLVISGRNTQKDAYSFNEQSVVITPHMTEFELIVQKEQPAEYEETKNEENESESLPIPEFNASIERGVDRTEKPVGIDSVIMRRIAMLGMTISGIYLFSLLGYLCKAVTVYVKENDRYVFLGNVRIKAKDGLYCIKIGSRILKKSNGNQYMLKFGKRFAKKNDAEPFTIQCGEQMIKAIIHREVVFDLNVEQED